MQNLETHWNELKSKVRQQWSQLTDQDLGSVQGNKGKLVDTIQKRYHIGQDQARHDVENWLRKQDDKQSFKSGTKSTESSSKAGTASCGCESGAQPFKDEKESTGSSFASRRPSEDSGRRIASDDGDERAEEEQEENSDEEESEENR